MAIAEVATQVKSPVLVELTIVAKGKLSSYALTFTDVLIWKRKTGILWNSSISGSQDIASLGYEEVALKIEVIKEFRLDTNIPGISHLPCNVRVGRTVETQTCICFSAIGTKHARIAECIGSYILECGNLVITHLAP